MALPHFSSSLPWYLAEVPQELLAQVWAGTCGTKPLRAGQPGVSYSVPEDFSAPLELPQQHFGLVDDYGIKPKQPHIRSRVAQERPVGLRRAGKSKRDELDLLEYYYDAHL
ncbi:protein Frey 1 [Phalacrocorax aristotelis]|uniref:protein Frey 1 n=1 Tax=Phalacrocorax aristotelis TaxID=126867 RepID=UPI003F4B42F8